MWSDLPSETKAYLLASCTLASAGGITFVARRRPEIDNWTLPLCITAILVSNVAFMFVHLVVDALWFLIADVLLAEDDDSD